GDLIKRVYEHKQKIAEGFTKKYNIDKLVYYAVFDDPENAITREKQIKAGPREKKLQLIEGMNPGWKDLYDEIATPANELWWARNDNVKIFNAFVLIYRSGLNG
ncbi:MAG: GIY-YIG nuclease family protein, partial [bacterium]